MIWILFKLDHMHFISLRSFLCTTYTNLVHWNCDLASKFRGLSVFVAENSGNPKVLPCPCVVCSIVSPGQTFLFYVPLVTRGHMITPIWILGARRVLSRQGHAVTHCHFHHVHLQYHLYIGFISVQTSGRPETICPKELSGNSLNSLHFFVQNRGISWLRRLRPNVGASFSPFEILWFCFASPSAHRKIRNSRRRRRSRKNIKKLKLRKIESIPSPRPFDPETKAWTARKPPCGYPDGILSGHHRYVMLSSRWAFVKQASEAVRLLRERR